MTLPSRVVSVTLPLRGEVEVFVVTAREIMTLFAALVGVTVSQVSDDLVVQVVLE